MNDVPVSVSTPHAPHVGVTVANLDRALAFYCDGLGCEVTARQESDAPYLRLTGYPDVEIATAFVRVPGDTLLLELQQYRRGGDREPRSEGTARPGSSHVCLVVADVDAAVARAEAHGGRRVTDPVDLDRGINVGGRAVYLRDPDGYTVELFQPPQQVTEVRTA